MAKCERCAIPLGLFSKDKYCVNCDIIVKKETKEKEEKEKLEREQAAKERKEHMERMREAREKAEREEEEKRKIGKQKADVAKKVYLENCKVKFLQMIKTPARYNVNTTSIFHNGTTTNRMTGWGADDGALMLDNMNMTMVNAVNAVGHTVARIGQIDSIVPTLFETTYCLIINDKYTEIKSDHKQTIYADIDDTYSGYTISCEEYLSCIK